jgi:hypothetical protein
VLRVEVAELKSRPALLGACTSCPVLHEKIDDLHAYTISLEAKLKEPIPTSLFMDKRRIPLRSASLQTPHLFHHRIPKVLVNPRSKGITSVRSTFTL